MSRILIADDHAVVRAGYRQFLEAEPSITEIGEASSGTETLSALRAKDFSGLPPAYVMLGGYDPLHDEGMAYAEKLRQAGVMVTVADHNDMVHCFIYLQTVLPQAHEAIADAAKAVRDALADA